MAPIVNELLNKFRGENIAGKYIYINVAVFFVVALATVVATLFNEADVVSGIVGFFELPAALGTLVFRPWSLFTYMFLHASFMHILWNMLALYLFGRIFLDFYSTRHFIGVYIMGGIVGGIFFVAAYNLFPYFANNIEGTYLVGASAAVLAIVTAAAVRSPNYTVNLLLFGQVRLSVLAIVTVLLSLILLASENAGGNFAHIGGAVAGWIFASLLGKGCDVTSLITSVSDFILSLWRKLKEHFAKPKMRIKRNAGRHASDYDYNARRNEQEDEMNRILDKIKKSGYSSLSDEEKKRLFDTSSKL